MGILTHTSAALCTPQAGGYEPFLMKHCQYIGFTKQVLTSEVSYRLTECA